MGQHIRYPADPSVAASSTQAGSVTTAAQTFAGRKTFSGGITPSEISTYYVFGGNAAASANDIVRVIGSCANTAAGYANAFFSYGNLTAAGARLASFRNNYVADGVGVEMAYVDKDGSVGTSGGAWNSGHMILGAYHLWIDSSSRLRVKSGAPTSDTDGTIVGTQT